MKHIYTNDPEKIEAIDQVFRDYNETAESHEQLTDAAKCYFRRKYKYEQPDGHWDSQKRWHPVLRETCGCCPGIYSPSIMHPYGLIKHCCTVNHVANLYDVKVKELRKTINIYKKLFNDETENLKARIEAL